MVGPIKIYNVTAEKGQTIVEFAFIVTLLLALVFGITEFGRAWVYSSSMTNGARAGARYASTLSNSTSFVSKVRNYTFTQITQSVSASPGTDLFVNVSTFNRSGSAYVAVPFANMSSGGAVTVVVRYDFQVLTGSIVPYFSGTKSLVRRATMRYEGR